MNPNSISVIVPVYNVKEYLENCISSIACQTYSNIEIILVDDGSTDGSSQLCDDLVEKFKLSGHNLIALHQENQGVTSARLNGVKIAKGEWIGFVDGDDEIEPDMYERLINNAIKYNADISHCGYQTIVNGGERIHYFYNTGKIKVQNNFEGQKDLLEGKFVEPGVFNKIYKKETIIKNVVDKINLNIRMNEDLLMNFMLFSISNIAIYEDFCPYMYMSRKTSVTRSGFDIYKVLDPIKVRKLILDNINDSLKDIAIGKYLVTCAGAYISIFNKKEYKKDAQELKSIILSYKNSWNLVNGKENKKLKAIIYCPYLYKIIYSIYSRFFQVKIYE